MSCWSFYDGILKLARQPLNLFVNMRISSFWDLNFRSLDSYIRNITIIILSKIDQKYLVIFSSNIFLSLNDLFYRFSWFSVKIQRFGELMIAFLLLVEFNKNWNKFIKLFLYIQKFREPFNYFSSLLHKSKNCLNFWWEKTSKNFKNFAFTCESDFLRLVKLRRDANWIKSRFPHTIY